MYQTLDHSQILMQLPMKSLCIYKEAAGGDDYVVPIIVLDARFCH